MTGPEKTSLCYTKYVSSIEFLRKLFVYDEICVKILRNYVRKD